MSTRKPVKLGRHIVADPEVCHGQLTFKGTRIMVKSVLHYVEQGREWDWISAAYDGRIHREAISEAVALASKALIDKTGKRQAT